METTATTADTIFDTWEIYQKIVSANNMFHQEIYADVAKVLATIPTAFSILDLGCGDAANLAPVLAKLPVKHYGGVDLSAKALALASTNLSALPCPIRFQQADLLHAVENLTVDYDVIFSSFAVHHLPLPQKTAFFKAARQHLVINGLLLIVDVVRDDGQNLADYLQAYCNWVYGDWHGINNDEKAIACQHITENDLPETLSTLQALGQQAGFSTCQTISQYRWHRVLLFRP
jgi:cyclopropane fatty-acyl-phospholipid synthase-like methyltransferase